MRAQLKMGETIVVLLIFFILLAFGMIFYAGVKNYTNKEDLKKRAALESTQVAQRIETLPEIQCTISGAADYDCIDTFKLEAFMVTARSSKGIYEKIFPNTNITVISAFPVVKNWSVYDGVYETKTAGTRFPLPVALYDPVNETHSFGMLIIEVYR
jgi:hypothetical protein